MATAARQTVLTCVAAHGHLERLGMRSVDQASTVATSVATALSQAQLGAVVGPRYAIRNESAITSAKALYRPLVTGLPIAGALPNGRLAIPEDDIGATACLRAGASQDAGDESVESARPAHTGVDGGLSRALPRQVPRAESLRAAQLATREKLPEPVN